MQSTSSTMLTALRAHELAYGSFGLVEVVEIYAYDYLPHATNGFEPDDAEERFCGIEGFTWLGLAYRREYVDRGDVQRYFDKRENSVNANFSNVLRYLATYVQNNNLEGKWLVIRSVALTSTVLADSVVLLCARIDKPGDLDNTSASITATQRFGQVNQTFPPRTFSPNDPKGRAPSDKYFEGFRFLPIQGSLQYTTRERRQGFGGLLGLTKKITHTLQYSSHANFEAEMVLTDGFGRVQVPGVFLATIDIGGAINMTVAFMEGAVSAYENVRQVNPKFSQPIGLILRYGYRADEGPPGLEQTVDATPGARWPAKGYYSRTAYVHCYVTGSTVDVDEANAPDLVALIKAKVVKIPDGTGAFVTEAWSHNPVAIARYLLADERYFNEGESALEDAVNYETYLHCQEHVLDTSQGERIFIPQADISELGVSFNRYRSTGLVDSRSIRMGEIGDLAGDASILAVDVLDVDDFDPEDPPVFIAPINYLRERYTTNLTITEKVTGTDFLHNTVAPTGRLYFVRNGKGKIEIRSERPADNTRLRSSTAATATTIPVMDVEPWRASLSQRLLVGAHLLTSEVRDVTAADYTADGNAITLTVSKTGSVTVTASGATFSGGSASVAASGTVTIGGSPAYGDTVTVVINGISVTLSVDLQPTTASVAGLLARLIHATPRLRQFIKATWTVGSSVVTLAARYGVLTLSSALVNTHTGQVANPTTAPTASASAGGSLQVGVYYVAHADRNSIGVTALSPLRTVAVAANQKIDVSALALPAGVTSRDWYVSKGPNSAELVYQSSNTGGGFSISTLPDSTNNLPPSLNTTGEEILRVVASYAANDQGAAILAQAGLTKGNVHENPKWPLGGKQSSVNMVGGTFYNATDDFAATPLEVHDFAHQERIRKVNKKDVDGSGFDNYNQFSRYCNFILSKNREGDFFVQFSTGPYGMLHEEGDVICVSFDNGGFVNLPVRIEEINIGKAPTYTTRIVARKYSTLMFSDDVRQHSIQLPTTLKHTATLDTEFQILDLPVWREEDRGRALIRIAARPEDGTGDWKGFTLWMDRGDGAGFVQIGAHDVTATMGELVTALPAASPYVFDTTNTVRVRVDGGKTLTSRTEEEVLRGANLIRANGVLCRFQTATFVSSTDTTTTYDLSGLLIGLYGTENKTAGIGDEFTLLDGSELVIDYPVELLHKEVQIKALTVNRDLAETTAKAFTWTGESLRHPMPVLLPAPRSVGGDILSSWRPTVQGAGNIRQGLSNPLSDEKELYRYRVLSDDGLTEHYRFDVSPGLSYAPAFWEVVRQAWPGAGTGTVIVSADGSVEFDELNVVFTSGTVLMTGGAVRSAQVFRSEVLLTFAFDALSGNTPLIGLLPDGQDAALAAMPFYFGSALTGEVTAEGDAGTAQAAVDGDEFTLRLKNGRVDYFRNYANESSVPFYTSTTSPADVPYRVVSRYLAASDAAGTPSKVNRVRILRLDPEVVITAEMQTEKFGGLKAAGTLRVSVNRVSSLVGEGQDRETFV